MKVQHRHWHRVAWIVLPAIVAVLFVAALVVRPPAGEPAAKSSQGLMR